MAKVAFIGLGVMGYPMARHLKERGGHDVTVYNRTAGKGGEVGRRPWRHGRRRHREAAAEGADFVFTCVGNDDDLRAVVLGDDGALAGMKPGAILIDNTTASAIVARELDAAARAKGCGFLDAPVSGGQAGAENGQLTVMVGGDPATFETAQAGDRRLRQDGRADGAGGRRPAHQDGQPDLHRRPRRRASPRASTSPSARASTSRR